MVAVVTSGGLGLDRSSANVLGGQGLLGQAAMGRAGEGIYVNAATGNLVITSTDEMLFGVGQDSYLANTYNSQAVLDGDNNDGWRESSSRTVNTLTGTLDTAGSTVSRTDGDGSQIVFTWDSTHNAYIANDGDGVDDTLTYATSTSTWTWTDGSTGTQETYDASQGGRLITSTDANGNVLTFSYNTSGLVSRVTTQNGEYTDFEYAAGTSNLIALHTYAHTDTQGTSPLVESTRVRYGYDSQNRLISVTVDLSPADNSITDGATYVTTYTYSGTSNRIASIDQTDGSRITFGYTQGTDGVYRLTSLSQVSVPASRFTSFTYDTTNRVTTISNLNVKVSYDAAGDLTQIDQTPPGSGSTHLITQFTYDSMGRVLTQTAPGGQVTQYGYDGNGNRNFQQDALGNTVTRVYSASNKLLSETRYLTPDPDGAGPAAPGQPQTSYFAYDANDNLSFVVSAQGDVIEYRYNASGERIAEIDYSGVAYDVSSLSPSSPPALAALSAWAASQDLTKTQLTETSYDFRGNVSTVTQYTATLASGQGDPNSPIGQTTFVYDQGGRLLQELDSGSSVPRTYVYDGLGRVIAATDPDNNVTHYFFNDGQNTTVIMAADGSTETDVYDPNGERIGQTIAPAPSQSSGPIEAGATATAPYTNTFTPLAQTSASAGLTVDGSYFVSALSNSSSLNTYQYDFDSSQALGSVEMDGLVWNDGSQGKATVRVMASTNGTTWTTLTLMTLAGSTPQSSSSIAVSGSYRYVRLQVGAYSNNGQLTLDALKVTGAPPTSANLAATATITPNPSPPPVYASPTAASAAQAADGQYFISSVSNRGKISALQYDFGVVRPISSVALNNVSWQNNGDGVATVTVVGSVNGTIWTVLGAVALSGSVDQTPAAISVNGSYRYVALQVSNFTQDGQLKLDQLQVSAPPITHTANAFTPLGSLGIATDGLGQDTYSLYDLMNRKVASILPDGSLTEYVYDANSNLVRTISYATKLTSAQLASLASNGYPTTVTVAAIRPAAASGDVRSYSVYDGSGRVIETIDPAGAVVQYTYDGASELVATTAYANTLSAATLSGFITTPPSGVVLPTANASADRTSRYFYDADGRQVAVLDADGYLTQTAYDSAGRKTQTVRYATAASSGLRASGTLAQLLTSVGTSANDIHQTSAYDDRGLLTSYTDGAGRTTTYTYDLAGRVATETDGVGDVVQYSYDAAGNLAQKTDARNVITIYTYDAENRLKTETIDPTGLNLQTTFGYDAQGDVTSVTDPTGMVTATTYDADGRKTSEIVDSGTGRLNLTTTYGYDTDNRVTSMTEGAGTAAARTTTYGYDSLGRLTSTMVDAGTGHENLTTTRTYDAAGNLASVTDPAGAVTRYVYNAFGQQIYAIDGVGDVTQTVYDADGRATQVTQYANALSATTLTSLGLTPVASAVAGAITASASDRTTSYGYNSAGQVTSKTIDPGSGRLNLTTSYVYDDAGNLLSTTDPLGYATRTVYDAAGRPAFTIDASGAVSAYTYDADGNAVKETQYAIAYTASGNPTLSAMQTWATSNANAANDRTTRSLYDDDGRLAYSIDAAGEVTAYAYDGAGRVTQTIHYATPYTGGDTTLSAMQTWASTHGLSGTTTATGDEITRTAYDTAGRVSDTYDATGVRTHYAYDGLGNVTDVTVAYGTSSAETTHNTYDTAGRLASTIVDYGTGHLNLPTSYQYDGDGRVTQVTDANSHVSTKTYNSAGLLINSTVDPGSGHLNLSTTVQYDAFGDKVKVTDPDGNISYFYYDNAGRLTLQVDPLGYATQTTYDADGNATQLTRYYNATSGAAVGSPPTITPNVSPGVNAANSLDEVTTFAYDHMGRLTDTWDAEAWDGHADTIAGHHESYVLDTFGDRTQVTNKLGGVTTSTYDHLGRLASQTQTITWTDNNNNPQSQAVTTTYAYDTRGNLTRAVQASSAPEQQTTNFTYDLDNRQLTESELVYENTSTNALATQSTQYDAFGNVVLTTDPDGNKTYTYYDAANRRIAQVDASGALTAWTYDGKANVLSKIGYSTLVTPTAAGGPPPAVPTGATRETDYVYDAADRLTQTEQPNVMYAHLSGATLVYGTTTITQQTFYDADGNVRETIDGNGNASYFYYDADSRKTAQVDGAGYLTTYQLDAEGNILSQTQYATAAPSYGWSTYTIPTSVTASGVTDDRTTTFTYDRNSRLLTQTRLNVQASTVSGTGALSTQSESSTVTYTYDGLGDILSKTQATGDDETYRYDSAGRQIHSQEAPYIDYRGQSVTPSTDTIYDRLGHVVQTIQHGDGTATAPDRVTSTVYGAGGRVISVTDPTNFAQTSSYDANGNLVAKQYGRQKSDGTIETDSVFVTYDSMNREISRKIGAWNGTAWVYGDTTDQFYDAYGDVVAEGTNTGGVQANAQKYARYDNAGRVWLTNMTGGVSRAYAYDANGNATILFQTLGTEDLHGQASLSSIFAQIYNPVTGAPPASITETVTVYDARNEVTDTIQPASSETYTPIQATQVDTLSSSVQFTTSTVTANNAAGYALSGPGAGAYAVGQAAGGYSGRGGPVSVWMDFTGSQWGFPDPPGVGFYIQWNLNFSVPPASLYGGGGTVHVFNANNTEIYSFNPGYAGGSLGSGSGFSMDDGGAGAMAQAGFYAGNITFRQDMPWGQVNLGSVYIDLNTTSGSFTVPHALELQGISSAAAHVQVFVRPSGSGDNWLETTATEDTTNWWHIDVDGFPFNGTANGSWDVRYLAFDGSGNIVNAATGTLTTDGNSTPSYSATPDAVYGAGQTMVIDSGGRTYLIIYGMPSGTTQMNIWYGSSYQNGVSLNDITNPGWGQVGLYALDITGSTQQQFWVQPLDSSGNVLGNSWGQFVSNAQLTPQLEAGQQDRTFKLTPPSAATSQSFRYSTDGGNTWSTWIGNAAGGPWTLDLGGLTGFLGNVTGLFEYQTNGANGQVTSYSTGAFAIGYNSGQAAAVDAQVAFKPQQTGVYSIKAYYRQKGTSGSFTEVTLYNAGNGVFLLNVDAAGMRPSSGENDYEYYYDAYDSNGNLIPPVNGSDHVHGYLQIQSNLYITTDDYAIQWAAGSVQDSSFQIDRQQTWDAFGEVSSQIDGRTDLTTAERTTCFVYNTLGEQVSKTDPQVTVVDGTGTGQPATPVETTYYDVSGREVGQQDANGDLTTEALLTDSGYDGQAAKAVMEFDGLTQTVAAQLVTETEYDAFGEARTVSTDAYVSGAWQAISTTTNVYDGDGNLIEVDHPQRSSTDNSPNVQLKDYYAYDGLGQRIRHTDSVYGAGVAETTDYDVEGRVTQTTDLAGLQTTYAYSWNGSLATTGLGTYGGWLKVTTISATNATGVLLTADDEQDVFGNEIQQTDFGSHITYYGYNLAGELTSQSNNAGQSLVYAYYANGYVASIVDNAIKMKSTFDYDNDGNRTGETDNSIAASPVYYENEQITYDAMNRVTEIKDPAADLTYSYDANGNRREVKSTYSDGLGNTVASTDYWYAYDTMNRFTVTMGTKSGSQIVAGATGVAITYDAAGNRHSAAYQDPNTASQTDTEVYSYTADGYLENTAFNGTLATQRTSDALGRVTSTTGSDGTTTYVYDGDNRITQQTNTNAGVVTTVLNDYKAWNGTAYGGADQGVLVHSASTTGGTTTNTNDAYVWWSGAQLAQSVTNADPNVPGSGTTALANTYDANGRLLQTVNNTAGYTYDYTDDALGEVMVRQQWVGGVMEQRERDYWFNGHRVGDLNNIPSLSQTQTTYANQTDYAQALASSDPTSFGKGDFREPLAMSDSDQSFSAVNDSTVGLAGQSYTLTSSDVATGSGLPPLQRLAASLWGDAALWYLIADANGLTLQTPLVAGQTLVIPNKVANFHDNASTFRNYSPSQDLSDALPIEAPMILNISGAGLPVYGALGLAGVGDGSVDWVGNNYVIQDLNASTFGPATPPASGPPPAAGDETLGPMDSWAAPPAPPPPAPMLSLADEVAFQSAKNIAGRGASGGAGTGGYGIGYNNGAGDPLAAIAEAAGNPYSDQIMETGGAYASLEGMMATDGNGGFGNSDNYDMAAMDNISNSTGSTDQTTGSLDAITVGTSYGSGGDVSDQTTANLDAIISSGPITVGTSYGSGGSDTGSYSGGDGGNPAYQADPGLGAWTSSGAPAQGGLFDDGSAFDLTKGLDTVIGNVNTGAYNGSGLGNNIPQSSDYGPGNSGGGSDGFITVTPQAPIVNIPEVAANASTSVISDLSTNIPAYSYTANDGTMVYGGGNVAEAAGGAGWSGAVDLTGPGLQKVSLLGDLKDLKEIGDAAKTVFDLTNKGVKAATNTDAYTDTLVTPVDSIRVHDSNWAVPFNDPKGKYAGWVTVNPTGWKYEDAKDNLVYSNDHAINFKTLEGAVYQENQVFLDRTPLAAAAQTAVGAFFGALGGPEGAWVGPTRMFANQATQSPNNFQTAKEIAYEMRAMQLVNGWTPK